MQQLFPPDATHNWPDEERWSEAETFSVQKQQSTPQGEHLKKNNATRNVCSGDVYKPRRPGDSSHRTAGAGRGDSAGLGQVSLKVSLSFFCEILIHINNYSASLTGR